MREGITLEGAKWTTSFGLPLLRVSCFGVFPPLCALLTKASAMAGVPSFSSCPFLLVGSVLCVISNPERFRSTEIQLDSTSAQDQ